MLEFKDIFITPDFNKLVVRASITDIPANDFMYIDSISIDTDETYNNNLPSSKTIYGREFESLSKQLDIPTISTLDGEKLKAYNTREISLDLDFKDLGLVAGKLKDHMFFVYVKLGGIPSPTLSCGEDKQYYLGVAFDKSSLVSKIIKSINMEEGVPSKESIDSLLKFKAFELAIQEGDIPNAIKYWAKFIKGKNNTNPFKCKCND